MKSFRTIFLLGLALAWMAPAAHAVLFFGAGRGIASRELRAAGKQLAEADAAEQKGDLVSAHDLYTQALEAFRDIQRRHPDAETNLVSFRIEVCEQRLADLEIALAEPPPDVPPPDAADIATAPAVTNEPFVELDADAARLPENGVDALSGEAIERVGMQVRVMRVRGQLDQAEVLLREALKEAPDSRSLRLWMALVLVESHSYDEAARLLEAMPDRDEDEAALLLFAAAAHGRGRPFDALRALDLAIQVNPRSAQAYMNMAQLRYRMNPEQNVREAETYYRYALRLGARGDRRLEELLGVSAIDARQ